MVHNWTDNTGVIWGQRHVKNDNGGLDPVGTAFKVLDPSFVHERIATPRALDVAILSLAALELLGIGYAVGLAI